MSKFIHENENQSKDNNKYTLNINNEVNNECIVCVETEEKGKLYNYQHECGNYKIHQNCLHEWLIKNGNDCFVCRKNAFTNEETIAFLTVLLSLKDQIDNNHISIATKKMEYDNIYDNQPNFGIELESTITKNDTQILPLLFEGYEININDDQSCAGKIGCLVILSLLIVILTMLFLN